MDSAAGKIWSGLLKDHYAPIWEMLLEAMRTEVATGVAMDAAALSHAQFAFSAAWVRQTVRVKSARLFAPSRPDGPDVSGVKRERRLLLLRAAAHLDCFARRSER